MELKVKEVSGPGQKSIQEVEEVLLSQQETVDTTPDVVDTEEQLIDEKSSFSEQDVLSFIRERYNKDISSVDELISQREVDAELPEDVSSFLKYKKQTGRGIEDFMKINVDYDKMNEDQVLREYYSNIESDLDQEDIEYLMSDKFSYDEDLDEDSEVKAKKIAKKKELAKAKKYFNDLKETYKVPIESKGLPVNDEELENYKAYKDYISQSQSIQEQNQKKAEYFTQKTQELFSDEFKGFEFKIADQSMMFSPGDVTETRKIQSDINNFISKYLDDNGMVKDHVGYHKALSAALNPDKLASYFYEKGKADAVGDVTRKSKNIDMNPRSTPQQMNADGGVKIRVLDSDSGSGLKIRKKR